MKVTGHNTAVQEILELVSSGLLDEALLTFKKIISSQEEKNPSSEKISALRKTTILLRAQYNDLRNGMLNGHLKQTHIDDRKSRISQSLIEMADTLKEILAKSAKGIQTEKETLPISPGQNGTHKIPTKTQTIQIIIDGDFDQYSKEDQEKLLKAIKLMLGMEYDLSIKQIREGSIVISLDIPADKYAQLKQAFREGKLDEFKVVKIDGEGRTKAIKFEDEDIFKSDPIGRRDTYSKREHYEMGAKIFVARLSYKTTQEDLQELFEEFGEVASVKVVLDRSTGRSKGFGFVEMVNVKDAKDAIEGLHETELDGQNIMVRAATKRQPGRQERRWRE